DRVRITRTPPRADVRTRTRGKARLTAVIVGASSKRSSPAYSSRISAGERTSKRAWPSRMTTGRTRAPAGAASASARTSAAPPARLQEARLEERQDEQVVGVARRARGLRAFGEAVEEAGVVARGHEDHVLHVGREDGLLVPVGVVGQPARLAAPPLVDELAEEE